MSLSNYTFHFKSVLRLHILLILFVGSSSTTFSQNIAGDWTGQLKFGGSTLDLNFKIFKVEADYTSLLSVPAQGLLDMEATSTIVNDSVLRIEIQPLGLTYQGKWSSADTIQGNFNQNGMALKLDLTRGEKAFLRPQEPLPPFSYYEEHVVFRNEKDSLNLSGTLTLPRQSGKFPVVVLVSGSGPQDRNSQVMGHKPFLLLAHELTKSGVGVLRYDERGVGASEGDFAAASLEDFKTDVKAAITFLKQRSDIDTKQIGLLGHSLGGIIAPQVAITEGASFLILMAAPGIDGDKLLLQQRADILKLNGLNKAQIKQSNAIFKSTYAFLKSTDAVGTELNTELSQFLNDHFSEQMGEKERELVLEQVTRLELLGLLRNQPSDYLKAVRCPVLAIGGSKDVQVASEPNLNAIKSLVQHSGNPKVEIKTFEGVNHLFQNCNTGDVTEYAEIDETMSPEVLKHITSWVTTHTTR